MTDPLEEDDEPTQELSKKRVVQEWVILSVSGILSGVMMGYLSKALQVFVDALLDLPNRAISRGRLAKFLTRMDWDAIHGGLLGGIFLGIFTAYICVGRRNLYGFPGITLLWAIPSSVLFVVGQLAVEYGHWRMSMVPQVVLFAAIYGVLGGLYGFLLALWALGIRKLFGVGKKNELN
jgi:hypothetical protein